VVAKFAAGGINTAPESITAGPDGNLWFTEVFGNRIGRMTPAGELTEFSILAGTYPRGITTGPDGALWFTLSAAVGRVTTDGQMSVYQVGNDPSLPLGDIAVGPDGNLWFTGSEGIRHISPKGGSVTNVPLPSGARPYGLEKGPDGNVWFTDPGHNSITRMGVSGALREFQLARRFSYPQGMAVGADGRIWFGEAGYGFIASIGVKVPEVSMSHRPLVFADANSKTVSVRNTGDARLAISSVTVTGLDGKVFVKGEDTCAGATLAPDAGCSIGLSHVGGGASGLQSAILEIADNATGSPQRLSLVAQVPQCVLPVVAGADANSPQAGEQLDVPSAQTLFDPYGLFERVGEASGVRTKASPILPGPGPGYFDRAAGRWLPVAGPEAVSPDGGRYAYTIGDLSSLSSVHVVDITTGGERVLKLPAGFWSVVAFGKDGIYLHQAYEGISPGLTLLDPITGGFKTLLNDVTVATVDGSTAWLQARNPADKLPEPPGIGGASNEIRKRDLVSGKTTVWFYRPGTSLYVVGIVNGAPIVSARDGDATSVWLVTAANQAQKLTFPFSIDRDAYLGRFVGDSAGIWVGSNDGIYLWTARTGAVLISDEAASPAGTCA
jgi:streptogramin lyase